MKWKGCLCVCLVMILCLTGCGGILPAGEMENVTETPDIMMDAPMEVEGVQTGMKLMSVEDDTEAASASMSYEADEIAIEPGVESESSETGTADARLEAITRKVKATLQLNTDDYAYFRGEESEDPLESRWDLYWTDDDGKCLSVTANDDGLILTVNRTDAFETDTYGYYGRVETERIRFPEGKASDALKVGERFVKQCLDTSETVEMSEKPLAEDLGTQVYRFRGNILLNGIPAGISCCVSVRASDYEVLSYSRTDWRGRVRSDIPDPDASVSAASAKQKLTGTIEMSVEYVLSRDGSKKAILAYKPIYGDTYYVDAKTGELVNLSEIARNVKAPLTFTDSSKGLMNEAATDGLAAGAADTGGYVLTDAELAGSARLNGVMDRETLDKAARKYADLGLDNYELSGCDYNVSDVSSDNAEDTVTAVLNYVRSMDGGNTWRRVIRLDAKTGILSSVWSSMYGGFAEDASSLREIDASEAKSNAKAFLTEICGDEFSHCQLEDPEIGDSSLEYSLDCYRYENGYPYYNNRIDIAVDATDGSISRYSVIFDDDITFESPDGMIDMDNAVRAWVNTYETVLRYMQVPFAVNANAPEWGGLKDLGIEYMYELVPGYALERDTEFEYIRAMDGEPVEPYWADDAGYAYDDIDGSDETGAMILRLAQYGIGLDTGVFEPDKALTADVLAKLVGGFSGSWFDIDTEELTLEKPLTRGEAVKIIIDSVFPAEVCNWSGIYRTEYADSEEIPVSMRGYAAIAGSAGLLDPTGEFDADGSITRGEAAVMIYGLLARFE